MQLYTYKFRINLTEDQLAKIKHDAKRKGFKNVSAYARRILLEKSTEMEEKINVIYRFIKEKS